jgi:hypothetical protein
MTNPRHFGQIDLFTSVMRTHVNNVNNILNSCVTGRNHKSNRVSTLSKCEQTIYNGPTTGIPPLDRPSLDG